MLLRLSFFVIISTLAIACQQKSKDTSKSNSPSNQLKDYYYPVNELEDGLIYVYENEILNNQSEYWLHKTVYDESGNQYLVSTQYNILFDQNQLIREWIVADGSLVNDYRFFQKDTDTDKTIGSQANIYENVRKKTKFLNKFLLAIEFLS